MRVACLRASLQSAGVQQHLPQLAALLWAGCQALAVWQHVLCWLPILQQARTQKDPPYTRVLCKGARTPTGLHNRAATARDDHGVPIAMVQEQRQAALPLHSCKPRWPGSILLLPTCMAA